MMVEMAEMMNRMSCELPLASRCLTPSGTGQLWSRAMAVYGMQVGKMPEGGSDCALWDAKKGGRCMS